MEFDTLSPDSDLSSRLVRYHLEGHRLLVSGTMDRRGGQDADVVGLPQKLHEVIDEPGWRW
jgi:hypothetical protein